MANGSPEDVIQFVCDDARQRHPERHLTIAALNSRICERERPAHLVAFHFAIWRHMTIGDVGKGQRARFPERSEIFPRLLECFRAATAP
jgi:hypothetical protein